MPCAGAKINAIENLGATQNQFDSIDLSDNAIIILEGFPKLPRLKTLLLSNNRVTRIARKLEGARAPCCSGCPAQSGVLAAPNCSAKHALTAACACAESIANLQVLMLTNNRLKNLQVSPPASAVLGCASVGPSEEVAAG